ncbi:MAG: dihydroneopterin aldolase family protein [Thermoplasmata archaeon]|nr:dihydroneopterin aldolase family protein [Thermoplasmata archaeon]
MADPAGPHELHAARLTPREALLFEAGIKLGGVFHQYLGIPVSLRTATGLARSIEAAVALQPYVERVTVHVDPARGGAMGEGRFAYRYLTPEMLRVRVRLKHGKTVVLASLQYRTDLRYSLMRVEEASERKGRRRPASATPRPRR